LFKQMGAGTRSNPCGNFTGATRPVPFLQSKAKVWIMKSLVVGNKILQGKVLCNIIKELGSCDLAASGTEGFTKAKQALDEGNQFRFLEACSLTGESPSIFGLGFTPKSALSAFTQHLKMIPFSPNPSADGLREYLAQVLTAPSASAA
jgi:hypothetical protein